VARHAFFGVLGFASGEGPIIGGDRIAPRRGAARRFPFSLLASIAIVGDGEAGE